MDISAPIKEISDLIEENVTSIWEGVLEHPHRKDFSVGGETRAKETRVRLILDQLGELALRKSAPRRYDNAHERHR